MQPSRRESSGKVSRISAASYQSLVRLLTPARLVLDHLKQTGSIDGQPKAEPIQRRPSSRSASTSSRRSVSPPATRRVYTPPSPAQTSKATHPPPPPMSSRKSPPVSPTDRSGFDKSGVRFTNRDPKPRPSGPRTFSQLELSTIDLKWGQLFENNGTPTLRLGQFLRGLANHIVWSPL